MSANIAASTARTGIVYVFHKDIVAEFLRWIVRQSPIPEELPDLNVIAKDLHAWFGDALKDAVIDGMYGIDAHELRLLCRRAAHEIPSVRDLNLSKVEREAGISVDDPLRPPFIATSRYDRLKTEYDFIDLDALAMNVSRTLCDP